MKELIAALKKAMSDLKSKAAAALTKLGPVDQVQATDEVIWALRSIGGTVDEIGSMSAKLDEIEAKFPGEVTAASAAALATRVAAGELVEKSAVDTLVAAAELKGETTVRTQVAAEKAAAAKITARRLEVTTAAGEVAAAALGDAVLAIEDFAPVTAEVTRRALALKGLGIDPEGKKETFAALLSGHPFDDAGKVTFDASIATVRAAAGLKPGQVLPPAKVQRAAASGAVPVVTNPGAGEDAADVPKRRFAF